MDVLREFYAAQARGLALPPNWQQAAVNEIERLTTAARVPDYEPGQWTEIDAAQLPTFYGSRLPAIREAAQHHGYAIGLHGSMRRDLDLIAAPWRDGASDADTLAHAIAQAACGIDRAGRYDWELKPAGRIATSIPICWPNRHGVAGDGHIDLSVMPAAARVPLEDLRRIMCGVGIVGSIGGHDVIRRESVIELIDRAIEAAGQEGGAA